MKKLPARSKSASGLPPQLLSLFGRYAALAAAMDTLPDGYLALGPNAEVLDKNRAAVDVLEACRHAIAIRNGKLVGATAAISASLEAALGWCRLAVLPPLGPPDPLPPRPIVFHRRPAQVPVVLRMAPVAVHSHHGGDDVPVAIVWIVDTASTGAEVETLRKLFHLTPAEARLAHALAGGNSLSDAADAMSVTRSTAKTHLGSVFAKTGVRRQAQLVRLMACLRAIG